MHSPRFLPLAGPFILAAVFLLASSPAHAGSATWSANPTSNDWNTAANWMPNTVPNGPSDIATFGASSVTAVSMTDSNILLDSAVFNSGAPSYTITLRIDTFGAHYGLTLDGAGVVNNSGVMQSFVLTNRSIAFALILFSNSASAGEMTSFSFDSGDLEFADSSTAGSAIFNLTEDSSDAGGTSMDFDEGTTAANATINASGGAYIIFNPGSSGGNATINLNPPSFSYLQFGSANAEHANVNCYEASGVLLLGTANAGDGTYTVNPGTTTTEFANTIYLADSATAGSATFILGGSMGSGLLTSTMLFFDAATAGNANLTANGGSNGGPGAAIEFHNRADGGTASIALLGNSTLDISKHMAAPATFGSLSGSGTVYLGARTLALGSNNASTTFAGVIRDSGGISQNTRGSLSKVGTGTLILTGTNLYTGGTTVSAGVLRATNLDGSATGPGAVQVNAGALGGNGMISGPVTIGTGSGSGATLAPSVGSKQPLTLSLSSLLTLQGDSTYTYKLSTQKAKGDQVVANGVTIESGAQFNFTPLANKRLAAGTVFTALSNTAATPISGTFANLADGSTLTAGRNKLLVSYTGGDGNDLTLTVQ